MLRVALGPAQRLRASPVAKMPVGGPRMARAMQHLPA